MILNRFYFLTPLCFFAICIMFVLLTVKLLIIDVPHLYTNIARHQQVPIIGKVLLCYRCMQFGQQFLLLRVHHYKKKMAQMQFSLLRLLNLQSHSTDNTFKGKGNKKRKVGSRNSLKYFRFLRFIIISFIMQEHQKEHQEPKDDKQEKKEDKKQLKPLIIPPFFVQSSISPQIWTPSSIGPMNTSYLSGAASFAGVFESAFNDDIKRMMGLTDKIILDSVNNQFGKSADRVYFKDPAGPLGNHFALNGLKPLSAIWRPVNIEIFDIKVQSTFITQKFYTNHFDRDSIYRAEISYETSETTTSQWNSQFSQSLGRSANAGINIKFISSGVNIETTQTTTIGQSQSFSRSVTLGTSSGLQIRIGPFESIRVELTASLGTAKARVTYDIVLDGYIIVYGQTPTSIWSGVIHSYWFQFNKQAALNQIINISSYGKDYIQAFPWDPNNPKPQK